jgi:hypothetical protein
LRSRRGKRFRYGVRIEEMLIVHDKEIKIISNFPVKQITVVDPIRLRRSREMRNVRCMNAAIRHSPQRRRGDRS